MRTETKNLELRTGSFQMTVNTYDDLAEAGRAFVAADETAIGRSNRSYQRASWLGAERSQIVEWMRSGRTERVADAEKLIESLEAHVETARSQWVASRFGAYPSVPDFLRGFPEDMRRRVSSSDDRAPIRVFVDVAASAGVSVGDFERRGVACLALAMMLSAERPVELYAFCCGTQHAGESATTVVRIPTGPLDVATACAALATPGTCRMGLFTLNDVAAGRSMTHDWFGTCGDRAAYEAAARETLGAGAGDIVVPVAHKSDPIVADPIGFVQRTLDEQARRGE